MDGKHHTFASAAIAVIATGTGIYFVNEKFILVGVGSTAGIWLTPDRDVDFPIYADSLLPSFVRLLWRAYWYPYSRIMPHRSFWSHFPVVSTLIRAVYVALPALLLGWRPTTVWWWVLVGLIVSDTVHWVMDGFPV